LKISHFKCLSWFRISGDLESKFSGIFDLSKTQKTTEIAEFAKDLILRFLRLPYGYIVESYTGS
jgi:hypothetical protein